MYFVDLEGIVIGRVKEGDLPSFVHSQQAAVAKVGLSQSFILVSHMDGNPRTWAVFHCCPGRVSRKLD